MNETDEIRARYSDLRNCDTQIWQDFTHLLKENERLTRFEAVVRSLSEHSPMQSDAKVVWCFFCGAQKYGRRVSHDSDCVWIQAEEALDAIPTQSERNFNAIAAEKE